MGYTGLFNTLAEAKNDYKKYFKTDENFDLIATRVTNNGRRLWALIHNKKTNAKYINVINFKKENKVWIYKELSELDGPYDIDCPMVLLNKATEPINQYSYDWRNRVVNNVIQQKINKVREDYEQNMAKN